MGLAKQHWMELQERGFGDVEGFVCADCFGDEAIKEYIQDNAESKTCDFCGRTSSEPIAAPADEVVSLIMRCLRQEWVPIDEANAPWDSEERAFATKYLDFADVLYESGADPESDISDAIVGSVDADYWARPFAEMTEDEELGAVWESFKETILHKARFVFYKIKREKAMRYDPTSYRPESILELLAEHVADLGLITEIPVGTRIVRVRINSAGKRFEKVEDLGSPPPEAAIYPNRMNPAGIPMFYGADKVKTAMVETLGDRRDDGVASVAVFTPIRALKVLDLTEIPEPPSLFDESQHHIRRVVIFLNRFLEEFTKPVPKDDRMNVEYVPTQVVTEYFRHVFRHEGKGIDGVKYPSSRVPGGFSYALFLEQGDCADGVETQRYQWQTAPSLRLKKVYWKSVTFKPKWTRLESW